MIGNLMKYVLALLALASPALAEQCGSTAGLYAYLEREYQESRVTTGQAANGMGLETWANLATGTWTMFISRPDGTSCVVANGVLFRAYAPEPNA